MNIYIFMSCQPHYFGIKKVKRGAPHPLLWCFPNCASEAECKLSFERSELITKVRHSGSSETSFHYLQWGFPGGPMVKNPPASAGDSWDRDSIPRWEDLPEKEMTTHSSTLAWKIPQTEEPDGLQSMGSQRVKHSWTHTQLFTIAKIRAQPKTPSTDEWTKKMWYM